MQLLQAALCDLEVGSGLEPEKTPVVVTSQDVELYCWHCVLPPLRLTLLCDAFLGPPRQPLWMGRRLTNLRNWLNNFLLIVYGEGFSTGLCYFGR